MRENDIIRRQQLKNMLYNLIAFAIIFITFGGIIYSQVKVSIYSKLDSELKNSIKAMENLAQDRNTDYGRRPQMQERPRNNSIAFPGSPRIIPIFRDMDGTVIDFGSVNDSYYEQYLKNLVFDKNRLNTIVPLKISNQYYFRSFTTIVKTDGNEELYLQVIINADSEKALLQYMAVILSICIVVFVVLSIAASYILSQKTMKPIKAAWNKQSEFVANVSHELRTPLTIIHNTLELLFTVPNAKIIERSENIGLALNETARLSKLVTDMLTLARSDSSMTEIERDIFSLDLLVMTVCEPYTDLAESQKKVFDINLQSHININADKGRIHQLLVILLDNALKYTNEGDRIEAATYLKDNRVCLVVADTGIGIGAESMGKVFDRFYREDKARSRERGGTGLGLSIADWIVTKHGGKITVSRNEPKGTVFTVKLPK